MNDSTIETGTARKAISFKQGAAAASTVLGFLTIACGPQTTPVAVEQPTQQPAPTEKDPYWENNSQYIMNSELSGIGIWERKVESGSSIFQTIAQATDNKGERLFGNADNAMFNCTVITPDGRIIHFEGPNGLGNLALNVTSNLDNQTGVFQPAIDYLNNQGLNPNFVPAGSTLVFGESEKVNQNFLAYLYSPKSQNVTQYTDVTFSSNKVNNDPSGIYRRDYYQINQVNVERGNDGRMIMSGVSFQPITSVERQWGPKDNISAWQPSAK